MPKQSTNIVVSPLTLKYYEEFEKVLKVCGKYAQVYKLRQNLDDPDTAWKVQRVLDDYYNGKVQNLERTIERRLSDCVYELRYLGRLLSGSGQVQDVDATRMAKLLVNESRRDFYKRAARRYKKQNLIVPIQQFETEYNSKGS